MGEIMHGNEKKLLSTRADNDNDADDADDLVMLVDGEKEVLNMGSGAIDFEDDDDVALMTAIGDNIVRDRKHPPLIGNTYSNVFVGNEAVDFLLKRNASWTRKAAVKKMASLFHRGAFVHVYGEHAFEDKRLFYRCCGKDDETSGPRRSVSLRLRGRDKGGAGRAKRTGDATTTTTATASTGGSIAMTSNMHTGE